MVYFYVKAAGSSKYLILIEDGFETPASFDGMN